MMLYNMLGRATAPDRPGRPTIANRYQPETSAQATERYPMAAPDRTPPGRAKRQRRSRVRTVAARSLTSVTPSALEKST